MRSNFEMSGEFTGRLIADKYRVDKLLRESDTGDIYLGKHDVTGSDILIRILPTALSIDQRWAKRFLDEARTAASLDHPNILKTIDFGTDSRGVVYAIHEPVSGTTLADILRDMPQISEERALNIALQTAAALFAASEKRLIHGSLSPGNIFIDGESAANSVKVLGFGSNAQEPPRDADPRYLAPEQNAEFSVTDARSDVYAVGAVIYAMLTGKPPFDGNSRPDVLAQQAVPPIPLETIRPDLHRALSPIVMTALAKEPDERYRSIEALAEDLGRVRSEAIIADGAVKPAAAAGHSVWVTAALVLAGIGLIGGALIYFTSGKKTDPTTMAMATDPNSMPVQPIGPATGAQEESLTKMVGDSDASIMDPAMGTPPGTIPGGDGYNPWANGGAPPVGAPPQGSVLPPQAIAPPGQTVTIDPNGGSVFMPNEGGIILVPIPAGEPKPTPSPKTPNANTAVQPTPAAAATPKPLATPPPKAPRAAKKQAPDEAVTTNGPQEP
ncbi:MAG: protein kinase [Acidobacteria bacterium]|nr:protein kinase [Acidobacteriota bacterium]